MDVETKQINDLGMITIPLTIRKNLDIKCKDKLEITISDNEIGRIEYEIYEIYKVEPEDVSCLSQDTNETREVTLITCTNDSKKRIIVKAREI